MQDGHEARGKISTGKKRLLIETISYYDIAWFGMAGRISSSADPLPGIFNSIRFSDRQTNTSRPENGLIIN
jgi:hypothetical protein